MREIAFHNRYHARWKQVESLLEDKSESTPEELADLYVQLTDDLAYARTFYPKSKTTAYLNQLSVKMHAHIYRTKKEPLKRLLNFWKYELPMVFYKRRKFLLYSFIIFGLSILIGAFSAAQDETFVRYILGDYYVNMTLQNMAEGKPMAVYEKMEEGPMFLYITFNNVRVSFTAFAAGLLASIGTGLLLFFNGIMLGSFQYFFYQQGYLLESVLSIWVHGTLEITAIIVAGGAGLLLGNSFLFPGTYSRGVSFRMGALDGVKMIVGLIPVFIFAGFLEGFVTRHSDIAPILSVFVISFSLIFVLFYFILYPIKLNNINSHL